MKSFSCRYDNLELRSCNNSLTQSGDHTTAEIVRWNSNHGACITIADFAATKDGFNLQFVGERPLGESVDWTAFKLLIESGFAILKITED